jgi:hypothetical protein
MERVLPKNHYHLAATKVIFTDNEDNKVSELEFNVVLAIPVKEIGIKDIGTIQQQAQMLFFKKLESTDYTVVDVFIQAISYLGHMTQEQFTHRPEPSKELTKAVKDALATKAPKTEFDA